MANIDEYIKQIQQAQYGEEVRGSIVNALKKVNDDNNSYVAIKKEVVAAKDIVEEKAEIFDEKANAAKETLTALQASTQIANEAKSSLNNIIISAISTKKELEQAVLETGEVIARVDNAKSNLDKSITSAGEAELNLQRQIETSNQIKNQLDVSNNTAIELKKNLDVAINEANTAKVKLVEAINNAGQTQTERVQTAGTTAVENIKTAQNTATQAVETAKAEAVKEVQTEGNKQVKAVEDKGKEVLESIPDLDTKLETKLDKNQGAEHAGKALVIGEDGNVVPGEVQTEGVGDAADAIINTVSGTLLNVKDSAERKNKGFEMSGKTTQDGTPTPDAPVEILNAGRLNEDTGKYEVDVKVNGANLLNEDHFFDMGNWKNGKYYMNLKPDTKYTFSRKDNSGVGSGLFLSIKNTVEGVLTQIVNSNSASSCKQRVTFTTNDSGEIYFDLQNNKLNLKDFLGFGQLEVGIAATLHEPYKEQTLTLTSDRPLTKWDRLVEQDGQIGWLYGSKSYKVTGKEIFESREGYNTDSHTNRFFVLNDLPREKSTLRSLAYVEKLKYVLYCYSPNIKEEGFDTNSNQFHIKFSNDRVGILASDDSTVRTSKFSEYMKKIYEDGKPIELLYMTTDTTFTPLPQSEQEAIRALQTYYPTTIVSNSENMEMELSYVADTKNYTDRKIEEAVTAQTQNLANLLSLMPLSTQAAMIEADTNNILDMEVQKMNSTVIVKLMENLINKKFYDTKDEAIAKLDVYFAMNRISEEEYATLALLAEETYTQEVL